MKNLIIAAGIVILMSMLNMFQMDSLALMR